MISALAVMTVILIAVGSAVVLASRSLPSSRTANDHVIRTAKVLQNLSADLGSAVYLTERTANALTFTLADRNNDGVPEVIRYAWSGTDGDPLTRQLNGGSAVTLVDDVHAFDLVYGFWNVNEQYAAPENFTSELLLSQHDFGGSWWDIGTSYPYAGQHFVPSTLPANALDWRVTRALIQAQRDGGADGQTRIQLRLPDGSGLPTNTVIAEQTLDESVLGNSAAWVEISFPSHAPQPPGNGLCLAFEHVPGGDAMRYIFDNAAGSGYLWYDGGPNWIYYNTQALRHYIYGVAKLPPDPPPTATRRHVVVVRMTLEAGDFSGTPVETAVRLLNKPEALTAVWEADFNADPTLMDLDLGGMMDWTATGSFNAAELNNGQWWVDGELKTNPNNFFTELTTVDARFRDTANDGAHGGLKLRVDRSGSTHALIQVEAEMQADSTQTLVVKTHDAGSNFVPVLTETGLPDDYFDLRIMVDPLLDTFNVQINGQDRGSFRYTLNTTAATPHVIEVYESASMSGVRFDHVRVRLGGNGTP